MKCYTARAQGQTEGTIIIARSSSQAAEIFSVDYVSQHGELPATFTVSLNDLGQIPLLDDLRLMMKGNVEGIADFDEEVGYTFRRMSG